MRYIALIGNVLISSDQLGNINECSRTKPALVYFKLYIICTYVIAI